MTTATEAPALPADLAAAEAIRVRPRQSVIKAHLELCKFRLNALVIFTTALGYVVGVKTLVPATFGFGRFLWTCIGTFLVASGASALNQALEAPRDARMHRTRNRPLCTGRLSRTYATSLGFVLAMLGVAIICPVSNGLTATLAAGNFLLYAFLYTPLKPYSSINTLVGAVVGGIPPMIGWTAATGEIAAGAIVLGGILFVWQIPHFLALAWLYREDYARGGFKMLPATDPTGRLTARLSFFYSAILMPLCLAMVYFRHAGIPFLVASFVMTSGLTLMALRFVSTRTNPDARKLFFASIIYLPLLAIVLMADARGTYDGYLRGSPGYLSAPPKDERFIEPGSPEALRLYPDTENLSLPTLPQNPQPAQNND